jgi:Spondin_N
VDDVQEGRGFFVDKDDYEQNYAYMPGIRVNPDYPFLSGIVSMNPSPDWFTGFYLLDVVDEYDRTYWNRIVIHTYPWDAGTDGGTTYTDVDYDLDPTINVERIYAKNALPNGIFLSPAGDEVLPVAEWDCALHVCNSSDDCEMENWPPANGCDKLKWPGCDDVCNPDAGDACEECKPKRTQRRSEPDASETAGAAEGEAQEKIFYKSCCQSNHEPLTGSCKGNYGGGSGAATAGIALSSSLAILSVVVTTIAYLGIM